MAVASVRPELLCAWRGPSLLIVNTRGECDLDQQSSGFYFREARFLRTLVLEINGARPWLCEAAANGPASLELTFVHPEITQPGGGGTGQAGDDEAKDQHGLPERSLDLRVRYRVGIAGLTIALVVANRARERVTFDVAWRLAADFADIQEAQAGRREQHAEVDRNSGDDRLSFTYRHPQLRFGTDIRHDARWRVREDRLETSVVLQPRQREELRLEIVPLHPDSVASDDDVAKRESVLRAWRDRFTRVEIPGNRLFERVLAGNVRDLASFPMLQGDEDEWLALQAGMPAYPAFFGRDAVTAGWQAGYVDRGEALTAALAKLRRLQSNRVDDWRDEQPGRIPYQVRSGPLALLNINPYSAYYADYASPLMFVIALANLWAWTGDRRHVDAHWDAARRILDWAREYGDIDGDGYLEYQTRSSKGTKNQGWKDSGDAIVYDDGRPVPSPIATCELQGYWYVAQELMALLSIVMDAPEDAAEHRARAVELKRRFNRDWWVEEQDFIALALDPDKQRVGAVTSNVGHCLACGIIDRERLPAVVGRMFAPDMFSGWGIRTLSSDHAFYNPLSYHRGTVWAVEQATTIFGLRRFGFDARALELTQAMFELALLYPECRIPECVGGYARGEAQTPGAYPRANPVQLWNATAFPLAVQTLLGLLPIASMNTLVVDPLLPTWLPELVMHDLRVGDAKVTLRFWRERDGSCKWDVLHRRGTLHVVQQAPPESLSAGWIDRASDMFQSVLP